MIPMTCPGCGRPGTIPPDKLNSRMHCKKCDAVFHMDASGHIVLGEPPKPGDKPKRSGRAVQSSASTANFSDAIKDMPLAAKIGFGVVAPLALFFYFFGAMLMPSTTPDYYAVAAVKAALTNDKGALAKLATPDSVAAADEWAGKLRADVGERPSTSGMSFTGSLMDGDEKSKTQTYAVTALDPAPTGSNLGTFVVTAVMEKQDDGKLLLNGVNSNGQFQPSTPQKAAPKKK